jgi:hypothetical protein
MSIESEDTEMSNLQVAKTILEQLGGNKFIVMTGARNCYGDGNTLSIKLPSTPHYVKDGINYVRITLTPMDDYTVEFMKVRGMKVKEISKHEGIYSDMLQELFTAQTGLATRLF